MTVAEQVRIWDREELLTGCQAVSHAVKLSDVDVIAAYPIRPYTEVMDMLSKLIADGKLDAEYIIADSEHSQFEIVKHASSVGARAFAGSSGTGVDVRIRGAGGHRHGSTPAAVPGGQSRAGRSGRVRGRAQRRHVVAGHGMADVLGEHGAGSARARVHRLPRRRGSERAHADGPGHGRRVPDPLPAHGEGADRGIGQALPAAVRSRRAEASTRTSRSPSRRRSTRTG